MEKLGILPEMPDRAVKTSSLFSKKRKLETLSKAATPADFSSERSRILPLVLPKRALAKGYYLSFGERCNKSPKTIEALKVTPLDRIFVESDESTTPIEQIYSLIANIRGVKSEELIDAIENNYNRIFSHDER